MLKAETIIWDYDGCIHDSLRIYAPAFRKAQAFLVENGYALERNWSDDEIRFWIGFSPQAMWQTFRPDLPCDVREEASRCIGSHMQHAIRAGEARLYPQAEHVLRLLAGTGRKMVLLSHCRTAYLEAHRAFFKLDAYFERFIATEAFGYKSKSEILDVLLEQYPAPRLMIGDRETDIRAGMNHGMTTVGCLYGYARPGELDAADFRIEEINALTELLT